jgi:hypothetical protein
MDLINLDSAAKELQNDEFSVSIVELGDFQLALIGGGIGDTQL